MGRRWDDRRVPCTPLSDRENRRRSPLGDAQKTESEPPPVMQSSIKSADAHGGREHHACFSSMPVPDRRLLGDAPRGLISRPRDGQNSLVEGKNAGNFTDLALFRRIRLESISEFRCLRMNSLRRQSRELFCQRREFFCRAGNEQGIRHKTDPRAPTYPIASEYFSVLDTKVSNTMVACADEQAWLLRTRRASDVRVEPQIKSGRRARRNRKRSV